MMRAGLYLAIAGFLALAACAFVKDQSGAAPEVPALAGSEWVLDGLGGAGLVSGREPTLTFSADGRISGTTGCNRFFGGYTQDGASLTFFGTGMTEMPAWKTG